VRPRSRKKEYPVIERGLKNLDMMGSLLCIFSRSAEGLQHLIHGRAIPSLGSFTRKGLAPLSTGCQALACQ